MACNCKGQKKIDDIVKGVNKTNGKTKIEKKAPSFKYKVLKYLLYFILFIGAILFAIPFIIYKTLAKKAMVVKIPFLKNKNERIK